MFIFIYQFQCKMKSVLTAKEFEIMPMEKQEEFLASQGTFLISRMHNRHWVDLYSLHDFFVEIWYVNFEDVLDRNLKTTKLTLLTDIITITDEKAIDRYIDLYKKSKT